MFEGIIFFLLILSYRYFNENIWPVSGVKFFFEMMNLYCDTDSSEIAISNSNLAINTKHFKRYKDNCLGLNLLKVYIDI